ncbi:MAG: hypothetical protein H7Z42_19500, partial [Roseiflexaceae bacterium]|nr:hypothetical protein [Roseiflexaceae bacterium]
MNEIAVEHLTLLLVTPAYAQQLADYGGRIVARGQAVVAAFGDIDCAVEAALATQQAAHDQPQA